MNNHYFTLLTIVISIFALFFAFYLQIEVKLLPCKLCIWQRWPHVFNVLIALTLLTSPNKKYFVLCIGFINMLLGTILATYHFGLEKGYWDNVFSCSGIQDLELLSSKDLLNTLKNTPIISCETPQWSLFNLSLVGWNVMVSGFLTLIWGLQVYFLFVKRVIQYPNKENLPNYDGDN